MTEKEKAILKKLSLIIPKLTESKKEYLLGLADGMAVAKEKQNKKGT